MIELHFVAHRDALLAEHDNTLDVLLRVVAPPAPASLPPRLPLNVALVLDRSGSMAGRPLTEARRCAALIIDALSERDRASLVVYDSRVDVLVPSQPVTSKALFHQALSSVVSGGQTALHQGWLSGAEQVAQGRPGAKVLSRVLLLSDGCANHGLTDTAAIARQCAQMAEAGVSTSTYGLGTSFNEELMTQMARAGQGNAYYGQSAEDLMDPFQEELDLLSALCARRLRLTLAPVAGVKVEVLNEYPTDEDRRVLLPDLAYGGEAWALLRLTVPKSLLKGPEVSILSATVSYEGMDGPVQADPVHLRLPLVPAAAFGAIAVSELVVRRAMELQAASLQLQGREAAQRGDWAQVEQILARLRSLAVGNPWLQAAVDKLADYARHRETASFSKEASYGSNRMRNRLAAREESADWSQESESQSPSYLRRKPEQGRRLTPPNPKKGSI